MKRENDVPMPKPLRDALRMSEPDEQRGLERIWSHLPDDDGEVYPNLDEAFVDISRRIEASAPRSRRDRRPVRARRARIGATVAAALIVIFIAAAIWVMYRPTVIETAAGEQRSVQLADGSVVELNSGTRLSLTSQFENTLLGESDARRVRLDGEAFFTVAESPRPFIVETRSALVRVTGTEFNVRARDDDAEPGTQVTLVQGEVVVSALDDAAEAVTLDAPGAIARVGVAPGQLSSGRAAADLDHVLAWRRQGFAFIDTPVDVILDELERRFDISIYPRTGVEPAEPMNLIYSRGVTPEEVLSDICVSQACSYRETSRGYALTSPSRP